ncbi:MAG: hypothetical protein EOO75_02700 [Myxococcales bacterium]|nr:MAG: hypothetical protein EOO75_02700 [Myxococcales bacterium]
MSSLDFVDLGAAQASRGVRMVVAGAVPSPWSEAAKGLFRLQGVPVQAVRTTRDDAALTAWMRSHNVPVVFHGEDPPRTGWAEIVTLAARLGEPGALVPTGREERVRMMGTLHEVAGEDGLGWSARLLMIDASLTSDGARGFPLPVARYLAPKYGHTPGCADGARERAAATLAALGDRLGGGEYFGPSGPDALDVYVATFVTPLCELPPEVCPRLHPALRAAFGAAREALADRLPATLVAHRQRMLERHLGLPIAI